jgi:hypothetical protein
MIARIKAALGYFFCYFGLHHWVEPPVICIGIRYTCTCSRCPATQDFIVESGS